MHQDVTYRLMSDAGIYDGMRVLDIGCGRGDVALLATRLVGTRGEVLGIDTDETAIGAVRRGRASSALPTSGSRMPTWAHRRASWVGSTR
jgi:ubiquinone/menaquinone biosynthesis C-methylase UbiE